MQCKSFLDDLKFRLAILKYQNLKHSLLGLEKLSEWGREEKNPFMLKRIQLILTPTVCFEMRLEY